MTETNRYNNGKIYKLVSNHTDKIYIGSTCKERLCQRLAKHKSNYKEWIKDNNNGYISSYELFELGDVEIVLIESVNCNTKDELFKKEREYIDKYKDIIVNKQRPITTKEEFIVHQKQYYEKNIEHIKQRTKKYRDVNKEKIKIYRDTHKEQKKEYITVNKDKINKTYECECGSILRVYGKNKHTKTTLHQKYLNSLQT